MKWELTVSDILKFLHDYPDDISLVMSKARVLEIIAEIEMLRGLIREARPFVHDTIGHPTIDLQLRMDAAIKGFEK